MAALLVVGAFALWSCWAIGWPYLRYSSAEQRLAASYLDEVEVEGYSMEKEYTESTSVVGRYYLGPATGDPLSMVHAPGVTLALLPPAQRVDTEFERSLASTSLPSAWPHCGLSVHQQLNRLQLDLSATDQDRFDRGELQIIKVAVGCGG